MNLQSAIAAVKMLETQVKPTRENNLMMAVIKQAIFDAHSKHKAIRQSATRYLNGPLPHAQAIGLEPSWVKKILRKAQILKKNA